MLSVPGDNDPVSKGVMIHHRPCATNFPIRDGSHSVLTYLNQST